MKNSLEMTHHKELLLIIDLISDLLIRENYRNNDFYGRRKSIGPESGILSYSLNLIYHKSSMSGKMPDIIISNDVIW